MADPDGALLDVLTAGLNPEQAEAVTYAGDGPLLVSAGPGTGKTEVVTRRIAYMVAVRGAAPENILAITFTNRAAGAMKKRARLHIGPAADDMWISTFHSACLRVLRKRKNLVGYPNGFTVADGSDSVDLCREVIERSGLPAEVYRYRDVRSGIAAFKHQGIGPDEAKTGAATVYDNGIASLYAAYQDKLWQRSAMDFDDLIMRTVELFRDHDDVLESWRDKFWVVLVDEYQDTNIVQNELVAQLAGGHQNLTVVGDIDQAIYGWRGASPEHLLKLREVFPKTRVVHLTRNYRSTSLILDAATNLIRHNKTRLAGGEALRTDRGQGLPVEHAHPDDERHEAQQTVEQIKLLDGQGVPLNEIAVLYRTNAQAQAMEDRLMAEGVPYRVVRGVKFYERAEIKDALAYLDVVCGDQTDHSVRRVANKPARGIGAAAMEQISDHAARMNISLMEALRDHDDIDLGHRAHSGAERFLAVVGAERRHDGEPDGNVGTRLKSVLDRVGYWRTLDSQERVDNVNQLLAMSSNISDPEELFGRVVSMDDSDSAANDGEKVNLMTLHSAKGLEYRVVFLTGASDGMLPHFMSLKDRDAMEEERRLAYVGITRAKDHITISAPRSRITAQGKPMETRPSRFLAESLITGR